MKSQDEIAADSGFLKKEVDETMNLFYPPEENREIVVDIVHRPWGFTYKFMGVVPCAVEYVDEGFVDHVAIELNEDGKIEKSIFAVYKTLEGLIASVVLFQLPDIEKEPDPVREAKQREVRMVIEERVRADPGSW